MGSTPTNTFEGLRGLEGALWRSIGAILVRENLSYISVWESIIVASTPLKWEWLTSAFDHVL